jgi:hypothetical protein
MNFHTCNRMALFDNVVLDMISGMMHFLMIFRMLIIMIINTSSQ